jgi:alginate production protein
MKLKKWMGAGMALGCFGMAASAPILAATTPDKSFGLEARFTGQSQDDADLGTRKGGDVNGVGIDLRPWLFGSFGNWNAFVMGQAVAATDVVETDPTDTNTNGVNGTTTDDSRHNSREPDKSYLALRNFWVSYSGLTAYPGEYLRLGRQRLKTDDGFWMDTDIESVYWNLDTTLLRAHVGAAQRFSDYRTDYDDLAPEDKDRLHVFGNVSYQWMPGHWLGAVVHHSDDSGHLKHAGQEVDDLDKTYTGDLTWLGLQADGDFFNRRSPMPLNYWGQLMYMTGHIDDLSTQYVGDNQYATGHDNNSVNAWGVDLGLRWKLDPFWNVGLGYARGSGGGDADDHSNQFRQTGLESNRSRFTGTRTSVARFGEAFRGELSNLQAATLFASWVPNDQYDASVIYHRFWRVDDNQDTGDGGISANLVNGEKDLGQELDLVVSRYFNTGFLPADWGMEESSTLVRFRGGLFKTGDAYGHDVDSYMHRAFVDVVWRF